MKKMRFVALVLALALLIPAGVFAKDGVELPMIPITPTVPSVPDTPETPETPEPPETPETPEPPVVTSASIKLSSDAEAFAYSGDSVTFTTSVNEIGTYGLSTLTVKYGYSNGLEFNNDIKGLPSGWSVEVTDVNNVVTVSVTNSNATTPASISFTFSFTVSQVSGAQQSVEFDSVSIADGSGKEYNKILKKAENNTFSTEALIPAVSNIGAALRINNTPALRFGMTVAKDNAFRSVFTSGDFSYSAASNVKFGMLVIEASKLSGELNVSTADVTDTVFTTAFSSTSNEVVFVTELDKVTDYSKEYVFRPYVMYRSSANSDYHYSYGEAKTRSAAVVARMELLSETDAKKIELLNKFIG